MTQTANTEAEHIARLRKVADQLRRDMRPLTLDRDVAAAAAKLRSLQQRDAR